MSNPNPYPVPVPTEAPERQLLRKASVMAAIIIGLIAVPVVVDAEEIAQNSSPGEWVGEYTFDEGESDKGKIDIEIDLQTLQNLSKGIERAESLQAGIFGSRKDYCCINIQDRRTKDLRASNKISAMSKCIWHYGGRSVTVHRGQCRR